MQLSTVFGIAAAIPNKKRCPGSRGIFLTACKNYFIVLRMVGFFKVMDFFNGFFFQVLDWIIFFQDWIVVFKGFFFLLVFFFQILD